MKRSQLVGLMLFIFAIPFGYLFRGHFGRQGAIAFIAVLAVAAIILKVLQVSLLRSAAKRREQDGK